MCTKHQQTQLHKVNNIRHKVSDKPQNNNNGDFTTTLSRIERASKQKVSKETSSLDWTMFMFKNINIYMKDKRNVCANSAVSFHRGRKSTVKY
jgi:hypothetical protein